MKDFFKKHKADLILVAVALIISIGAMIIMSATKTQGGYAVVVVNGKETQSYSLDKDITVKIKNGENYNILLISDGSAKIIEATCPDKLCVDQHEARYNGESLICLPNKTTVKIVSSVDSDIDFIS